jgi:hypothetical protein
VNGGSTAAGSGRSSELARRFRAHDERELEELTQLRATQTDEDAYWERVRGGFAEAERLMRDEDPIVYTERDAAWDNESLRRCAV